MASPRPWKPYLKTEYGPEARAATPEKLRKLLEEVYVAKRPEAKLRAFNLIRSMSTTKEGRSILVAEHGLFAVLSSVIDRSDESLIAGKMWEHMITIMFNVLNGDSQCAESVLTDELCVWMLSTAISRWGEPSMRRAAIVASAVVREISEDVHVKHLLILTGELFNAIIEAAASADEGQILAHLLGALSNCATSSKAQFVMARSAQLMNLVTLALQRWNEDPARLYLSLSILNALLSWPHNIDVISTSIPTLPRLLLDIFELCTDAAISGCCSSCMKLLNDNDPHLLSKLRIHATPRARLAGSSSPDRRDAASPAEARTSSFHTAKSASPIDELSA